MKKKFPFIIAEIANSHQGDIEQVKELIDAAIECGADAIKFQWFKYDCLATKDYEWYEDYVKLFISEAHWEEALNLARQSGLSVWVDIFDYWGMEMAAKFIDKIDGIKLPPTVIKDDSLLTFALSSGKPILVGVGGWYDDEIDEFLKKIPEHQREFVTIMHGFQGYPTKPEDANLVRIKHLKDKYGMCVGFADHEDGSSPLAVDLPVYSYFAGATVIEKHLTLDRSLKGYDYYSSLEISEFQEMVKKLEMAKVVKGDILITENQRDYLKAGIKAVAKSEINTGELIWKDKYLYKRCPAKKALEPDQINEFIPRVARETIVKDGPITIENTRPLNIVIAVICRLKSTRLTKKAIRNIHGISSIERCLINCLAVKNADKVLLATSNLGDDRELENYCLGGNVDIVFGDADNVLNRMLEVADQSKADIILRVTGDCPVASPEIIDFLIDSHIQSRADFTTQGECHAVGTGADVYTVEALRNLRELTQEPEYTEYLSYYFKNNLDIFDVNIVELPEKWQYPQWRMTLDEVKDLEMFEALYKGMDIGRSPLYFSEIVDFLQNNPEIPKINEAINLKWKDDKTLVKQLNRETIIKKK